MYFQIYFISAASICQVGGCIWLTLLWIKHTMFVRSPSLNVDLLDPPHQWAFVRIFLQCVFSNVCSMYLHKCRHGLIGCCIGMTLIQIELTKSLVSPSLNANILNLIMKCHIDHFCPNDFCRHLINMRHARPSQFVLTNNKFALKPGKSRKLFRLG